MPFIHPAIFWTGLGLVSLPIIIHLLNRRRFRVLDWAAMRFLLDSIRKNRRRLRIEELILLILRCLIIFLLACMVARFTGCAATDILPAGTSGSKSVVFVLDDSYSMGQKLGAGTLFAAARTDLQEKIASVPESDRAAILLTSRPRRREAFFDLNNITDGEGLLDQVKMLRPSDIRTDLSETLETAIRIFNDVQTGSKRLYVLSDFRRVDLADRQQIREIGKKFARLKKQGVEVVVMDYGRDVTNNLTVENVRLLDRFVVAKSPTPARIGLSVRNNGPSEVQDVQVHLEARFQAGGRTVGSSLGARTIASILPGESVSLEIPFTPTEAGSAVLTVKLQPDELPGDNVAHVAMNVRKALKVLILDGNRSLTEPEESESFFFSRAIDPNGDGGYGNRAEVFSAESVDEVDFDKYDVVALLNVRDFPSRRDPQGKIVYPRLDALERYVASGGGLIVFTGENANPTFYNGPLYAGGSGLNPFRLGERKGDPTQLEKFFQLDPKSIADVRFLRIFAGEAAGFTRLIRFTAFHAAQERAAAVADGRAGRPKVLARFTDSQNSPAIVGRQFGRGRVLMFYTTASKRWNDWPIETEIGTYVTVLQDAMTYLARPQIAGYTERIGVPVVFELGGALKDATGALMRLPNYPDQPDRTPGYAFDILAAKIRSVADELEDAGVAGLTVRALRESLRKARQKCVGQDSTGFKAELDKITGQLKASESQLQSVRDVRDALDEKLNDHWQGLLQREFHVPSRFSGVYKVLLEIAGEKKREILFARNVDPVEGRLAPAGKEGITTALGSGDYIYVDRTQQQAEATTSVRQDQEYWVWALVALLVLLAVETFLGQRFGHYS